MTVAAAVGDAGEPLPVAAAWGTTKIENALRTRFCPPEFATLFNVSIHGGSRFVDAMAMSQFGSRGFHLHGFEIKASRSDWLRELKRAEKAEEAHAYCHFWWLVVGDRKIVKENELPEGWGLLAPSGDNLRQFVKPAQQEPRAPTWRLMAAIFRRAQEQGLDTKARNAERAEGYAAGKEAGLKQIPDASLQKHAQDMTKRYDDLVLRIGAFEQATGIPLSDRHYWPGKNVGDAVRLVMNQGHLNQRISTMDSLAAQARRIADLSTQAADELRKVVAE